MEQLEWLLPFVVCLAFLQMPQAPNVGVAEVACTLLPEHRGL